VLPPRPKKILLVRFSALGDVIQTLPILTMLRSAFPEAKIGWAIDAELVPVIEGHPALDYIHPCHRRRWSRALLKPGEWRSAFADMRQYVEEVRSVGYDVAVDAQGLFKTALLPWAAGIKRRIGYSHGREFSSFFYTETHLNLKEYFDPAVFHLEHMAVLARAIGAGDVRYAIEPPVVAEEVEHRMHQLVSEAFASKAPVVAMAPATQWESKHWPAEYWVSLLDQLLAQTNYNLLLVGSKGDAPLVQRILQALPHAQGSGRVCDVSGRTSVREMYALYKNVDAAVGSDSAPLHIAGAVQVPVLIGIYGPTGYRRTPPIGSEHITLLSTEGTLACQPCHKRVCPLGTLECMRAIRPQQVFEALTEALKAQTACPATVS
jgi:lipopolysaccharide heptosyltransferase I